MEYADKIGDLEYKAYRNLFQQVEELKSKIDEIRELVEVLRETYVKKFADRLNSQLMTDFAFDVADSEQYDLDLTRAYNMTGGYQLRLDLLQTNLNVLEGKFQGSKDPDREYYLSLMITLSDNAGYNLSDNITVFEFCERMDRAHKKTEKLKKMTHGRK